MARKDRVKIVLVSDADECVDEKTGKPIPFYNFADAQDESETFIRSDGKLATLEELAQLCDGDAESINAHDYCGAHRLLASVLYRFTGRKKATKIMLEIAMRRGLHGMGGMCGTADSYAELGVGKNGHHWNGSFGK